MFINRKCNIVCGDSAVSFQLEALILKSYTLFRHSGQSRQFFSGIPAEKVRRHVDKEEFSMKKYAPVLAMLLFFAFFAKTSEAKTFLSIATGGTGGTYYPLGRGIAEILNRYLEDIQVTVETGNASVANINLIGAHQVEMAFAQNDIAYWGAKGMKPFREAHGNIRVVASLYPEHVHCFTRKNSGVRDIADIRGKRVSVGAPGSGVQGDVSAILDIAGLKFADLKAEFLDFNTTTQRFKDAQIDVGFVVAGYPTSSVLDLAQMTEIDMVSFNDAFMTALTEKYPFFVKSVIPAGTYRGMLRDVATPAVLALLVCDAKLPDSVVYSVTKTLWTHADELYKVHEKAKLLSLKNALRGISVPVHPGAARFYIESGMKPPELMKD